MKVHYHGTLQDFSFFYSSSFLYPLYFEVGAGMMIAGFENGVMGMSMGDKKTIHIPASEAYGEVQEEMMMEFPIDRFPEDMKPEVGMTLNMSNGAGQHFPVVITEIKEEFVILDANHPLAGRDLIFDIEVVDIKSKSPLIILP